MMPKGTDISTNHYHYDLPAELIAQFPRAERTDARLMLVDRSAQSIQHFHVRDLPALLNSQDLLVRNNSRVVPAKLKGARRKTGGRWSGLFLEQDASGLWKLLGKTRGKIAVGETIDLTDRQGNTKCQLVLLIKMDDGSWVARCTDERPALDILREIGSVPLPPYIRQGNMVDADVEGYQTVYACQEGSVAAPTAGLHFTEPLISQLESQGVEFADVTLHVGIGSFKTISSDDLSNHQMHSEMFSVSRQTLAQLHSTKRSNGRVIAVGTTSMRVLETVYGTGRLNDWHGSTNLFIRPGFQFCCTDALLTNFHLPRSTLLVLVRTFGGDDLIQQAYRVAIEEKYRFFSYGDAMLII